MSTESVAGNSIIGIDGFYSHFLNKFYEWKGGNELLLANFFSISKFYEIKPQKMPFVLFFLGWESLLNEKDDLYQNEEAIRISGINHFLFGMNSLQPQFAQSIVYRVSVRSEQIRLIPRGFTQ